MTGSQRGYSSLSNGQTHWRQVQGGGSRPPLLCLHMMPKSSRSFEKIMPQLARQRRVLAPDIPGYGASDPLHTSASVPAYARWLLELLDALELTTPLDIVGYHTGSMLAVALARLAPSRVRRIINISAPAFDAAELKRLRAFFTPTPLDEAGTRFSQMWERILHFRGPGMTLEMAAASLCDNLLGGEAYEEGHRAAFDHAPQYLADLTALPHELLVMNIRDDLFEVTRAVDPHLNNARRRDYPQWGNGFLELHAADAATEMLDFFDR